MMKLLSGLLACLIFSLFAPRASADPTGDERRGHPRALAGVSAGAVDGLPWKPPTPARPLGTILVGYTVRGAGPRLVEWDLSRGEPVRTVVVPAGSTGQSVALARRGDGLVVVASEPGAQATVSLLSPSLQPTRTRALGPGENAVAAADELGVFAAWLDPGHSTVTVASLDPSTGAELARRRLPLAHEARLARSQRLGEMALASGRVWLRAASGELFVLSRDLQELTSADLGAPRSSLLLVGDRAALALPVEQRVVALTLAPDLSVTEQRRLGDDSGRGQLLASFDPARGFALDDGRVVSSDGSERQGLIPWFEAQRVFWAHGTQVILSVNDKATKALVLWSR